MASILVAEDSEAVRVIISSTLKNAGHDVIETADGNEALALCVKEKIDLVVLDIGLPNRNGLEIAKHIQYKIPFIIITANSDEHSSREAIARGALSYMVKPVSPEKLLPCIEAALARAEDFKNLEFAMDKSRTVSTAIGILAGKLNISVDNAKMALLKTASDSRKTAQEVAVEVIEVSDRYASVLGKIAINR